MMYNKENKSQPDIVWINGATSATGISLAQYYSTHGDKIILSADNRDELYRVKALCKGNPMNIHIVMVNYQKPEEMLDRTKEALRIFGRIDTLVLCGLSDLNRFTNNPSQEEAKTLMDINLWTTMALTKAVLPIMKRQESGQILAFTSLASKVGIPGQALFSAIQHALHGYFESVRAEQTLPIYITLALGHFNPAEDAVSMFIKKLAKHPDEIIINEQDTKLLRLRLLRPKLFSERIKQLKVF